MIIWRCSAHPHWVVWGGTEPTDHWATRLDGKHSTICRGPFEQWSARRVA